MLPGPLRRWRAAAPSRTIHPVRMVLSVATHFTFIFVFLTSPALDSYAQGPGATSTQVEAAYLYNFGKFVSFPPDRMANSDFEICVLGKDPLGGVLDSTVQGENINGKKITIARLLNMQPAQACSILFVSSSEENHLPAILKTADQLGLLTVSEIRNFAARGGIIELVQQQDKIRFEVNRAAAQHSHLVLSSELLKVAVKVIEKGGPED